MGILMAGHKPPAAPVRTAESFRPQVVGSPCVVCGQRIIMLAEGQHCEQCNVTFHGSCSKENGRCPNCDTMIKPEMQRQ